MNYGVIFDCDGVLVDSEPLSCAATVQTLNQFGVKTCLTEVQQFIGKATYDLIEYYERRDGIRIDLAQLVSAIEANYFGLAEQLQPMPGLERLLQSLTAEKIPLAVASSGEFPKIRFSLTKTGLLPFFPVICSATEVKRGKPDPDLFLYAAQQLGVAPKCCYVVEDSLYGVMAGKKAGMMTIGYTSSFSENQLLQAGADWIIGNFDQLRVKEGQLELTG